MAADPLVALLKLRRLEVDEARRVLADCHSTERAARAAVSDAARALVEEAEAASRLQADDAAVEAFAAWLPVGRAAQARADSDLAAAEARTAEARAALALCRAALRAAEELAAAREAAAAAERQRQEQLGLDEIGSRGKRNEDE